MFAFLAEHRDRLFPAQMFEDLFPSGRGRPSLPPDVVAVVIVLKTLHGFSDREAADAVTFDLRWKAACGAAIDAVSFHPSTLTYWRRRLAVSQRPHRIFEVVRELIIETGAVKDRSRRALDSTVLDDAVARQDTVTQLIAAIRRVAREVPGAGELVNQRCTGHDYTRPGKPRIAWDDPVARDELISALVNDALVLLDALDVTAIEKGGGKAAEAVALLALVAGQDVEPADGSDGTDGRWRIARKVAEDRMISVVDPEARHAHKTRERRQDGFKAHIVIEPDTGLTTAVAVTKSNGAENSDAAVGADLLTADTTLTLTTASAASAASARDVEVLGDSAYGTGEMLHTLDQAGYVPVIKPWPTRPAVEGGFTINDFVYDEAAGTPPTASPGRCPRSGGSPSAPPAAAARSSTAAPPPPKAARSPCTSTKGCNARTASEPATRPSRPPTAPTDQWSNAPSPGSSGATAASPTAASPRTTPGSTTASLP